MRTIDVPHQAVPLGAVLMRRWILMGLACVTAPTLAAETSSTESSVLEEVTVTAQRRSESLQTVPIAITAVTAADIDRKSVV